MNTIVTQPAEMVMGAPDIKGLSFYHFRGHEDFGKLADLINLCRTADGLEEYHSAEELEIMYSHLNHCDLRKDFLMAEVNGAPVAYSRVFWSIEQATGDYLYTILGGLAPAWRKSGIGRAMLRYNENRLCQVAKDHPKGVNKILDASAWDTQPEMISLLEDEGYQAIRRHFSMERPDLENIPKLPLPEGLEVRPVRPDQYRQVWEASNEAFRDHWGYVENTEEDYQGFLDWPLFKPELWQVAWDGEQVAGMVLNFIDEEENRRFGKRRGWTENICVRRPYRKRGLARALIARSLIMLKEMDQEGARLGVDAQNLSGALQLYQSMGFVVVRTMTIFRKPLENSCR